MASLSSSPAELGPHLPLPRSLQSSPFLGHAPLGKASRAAVGRSSLGEGSKPGGTNQLSNIRSSGCGMVPSQTGTYEMASIMSMPISTQQWAWSALASGSPETQ